MPKLVHAADLHLDSPLIGLERYEGAPVAELRRATRGALDRLVELCIAEEAAILLIAGDLFDGNWRDYSTGLFLVERMTRLREAGVKVVWIRGNHDAASRLRKHLRMPENVRELQTAKPESVAFEDLNLVIHGQGFAEAAVMEDLTRRYPAAVPARSTLASCTRRSMGARATRRTRRARCRRSSIAATTTGRSVTFTGTSSCIARRGSFIREICRVDTPGRRGRRAPWSSRSTARG